MNSERNLRRNKLILLLLVLIGLALAYCHFNHISLYELLSRQEHAVEVPKPAPLPSPKVAENIQPPPPVSPPKPIEPAQNKPALKIFDLTPSNGARLEFTESEFLSRTKNIEFKIHFNKPLDALTFKLRNNESASARIQNFVAVSNFVIHRPGQYSWDVIDSRGEVKSSAHFEIQRSVRAIHVLPPLNFSNQIASLPTLRWQPLQGPTPYLVKIFKEHDTNPFLTRKTSATELKFSSLEIPKSRAKYNYVVEKSFEDGFVASSGVQEVVFEILPPTLNLPMANTTLTRRMIFKTNNSVFLSWSKMSDSSNYQLEIATEPSFQHPVITQTLKDNFYPYPTPASGKYFWRVRAETGSAWTEFSKPHNFAVDLESE